MTTISLYERYQKEIATTLGASLGLKNKMEIPRVLKVCVNVGMGSYLQQGGGKDYSVVEENLKKITGRKPLLRKARMSISNFKLREGMSVGMLVTLRGKAAYDFLDKVINIVFPRVQGFRGVKKNIFDAKGNCSFGFKECTVFPEIIPGEHRPHGVQITVVTSSDDSEHAYSLLKSVDFPFIPEKN